MLVGEKLETGTHFGARVQEEVVAKVLENMHLLKSYSFVLVALTHQT